MAGITVSAFNPLEICRLMREMAGTCHFCDHIKIIVGGIIAQQFARNVRRDYTNAMLVGIGRSAMRSYFRRMDQKVYKQDQ